MGQKYGATWKIESVHLQYMKQLLGVRLQTQNNFIYGELGRFPLQIYRVISVVRYWLKIITLEDRKYAKIAYKIMLTDLQRYPNRKN